MNKLAKLRLALLLVLTALAGVGLYVSYSTESTTPGVIFAEQPIDKPGNVAYVAGAVNQPGLYEVDGKLTVGDVIRLAGGFSSSADPDYVSTKVNLADIATAGQKIEVPAKVVTAAVVTPSSANLSAGSKVSINAATKDQLMSLPGVGEVLAGNIIAARPFNQLSDLQNAKGIGDAKYKILEPLVSL